MARWTMKGQYMEACSCNFLCPCIPKNATTPATYDFCKVALAFAVDAVDQRPSIRNNDGSPRVGFDAFWTQVAVPRLLDPEASARKIER